MRFRLRLFLAFILLTVITLVAVDVFASQSTEREVKGFLRRGGLLGTEELVLSLEEYYQGNGSWQGVADILEPQLSNGGGGGGGGGGKGQGRSDGKGYGVRPDVEVETGLKLVDLDGSLIWSSSSDEPTGSEIDAAELRNSIALHDENDKVAGYLLAGEGLHLPEYESNLMDIINHASMHAAILAGAVSVILALIFSYFLLRPVTQLIQAAEGLAGGDLSHRVNVKGKDELAVLGNTFNQMASSLEEAEIRRKALVADIAHELRTPLAVQRANLEAIQDGVYPMSLDSLKPIVEQTSLLTRLVEDLRTLALADAGELSLRLKPVDLAFLVASTLDRFQSKATEKNIQLKADLLEDCPLVEIDPERVQQILHNLLQNSLRHTPEDGKIVVSLQLVDREFRLVVHDSGEGIPQDAMPHIFERFYRVDRSRSRMEGGTGLGLAIARQLARAHGGDLQAGNHFDGGAVFTLTLPFT